MRHAILLSLLLHREDLVRQLPSLLGVQPAEELRHVCQLLFVRGRRLRVHLLHLLLDVGQEHLGDRLDICDLLLDGWHLGLRLLRLLSLLLLIQGLLMLVDGDYDLQLLLVQVARQVVECGGAGSKALG